jgi:flagellar biogenesis protein FliO
MWKKLLLLAALGWSQASLAGAKVTGLHWAQEGQKGRFAVGITSAAGVTPDWAVRGNRISIIIPGANLDRTLERYIDGTRLAASNVKGGVLATLTFLNRSSVSRSSVFMTLENGKIEVTTLVPAAIGAAVPPATAPPVVAKAVSTKAPTPKKEELGEDFLKKLEAEDAAPAIKAAATPAPRLQLKGDVKSAPVRDEVKSAQAAPARSSSAPIVTYAVKFIGFLGVVLLFFWGAVQLMKKGFLSKGKLGFLNGSSLVSVISTTYVSPKRAILLVKAHTQVFLVASSEAGFEFLSEVRDVPGLVKEGERHLTGTNFDDSTKEAEASPVVVRLKEDIYQSAPVEEKAGMGKDIARFSDELKKKVKNLKALQ